MEKKSKGIGKLIGELEKNYGVDIVMVLREGVIILATDEVRAKVGDTLIDREKTEEDKTK